MQELCTSSTPSTNFSTCLQDIFLEWRFAVQFKACNAADATAPWDLFGKGKKKRKQRQEKKLFPYEDLVRMNDSYSKWLKSISPTPRHMLAIFEVNIAFSLFRWLGCDDGLLQSQAPFDHDFSKSYMKKLTLLAKTGANIPGIVTPTTHKGTVHLHPPTAHSHPHLLKLLWGTRAMVVTIFDVSAASVTCWRRLPRSGSSIANKERYRRFGVLPLFIHF